MPARDAHKMLVDDIHCLLISPGQFDSPIIVLADELFQQFSCKGRKHLHNHLQKEYRRMNQCRVCLVGGQY
jgi:hypothetical protein